MALFRRSSRTTLRIVWSLCLLAVVLSTVYIWRYQRARRTAARAGNPQLRWPASSAPLPHPAPAAPRTARSDPQPTRVVNAPGNVAPAVAPVGVEPVRLSAIVSHPQPDAAPESPDLDRARDAFAGGDVVTARRLLSGLFLSAAASPVIDLVRGELTRVADATVFSRAIYPGDPLATQYTLQRGDTLDAIARRYQVTADLLASINRVTDRNHLSVGRSIKVVRGPFNLRVTKADYRLDVLLDNIPVRSMRCGLGVNGSTPTGRWKIGDKLANPAWTDPRTHQHFSPDDPDNPIGEYWLALVGVEGDALGRQGFGIHGTTDPGSIGRQASLGCVRLAPDDIEAVYRLVVIRDSQVEIVN
ncbi:MAG: L,D-transpeptidase family protein [Phycisphaerae bacterium]